MHGGLSDIKDCFHRLKQPVWMQRLFCFDPIPARWVNLQGTAVDGEVVQPHDLIYPMPVSLPMGCSWSLYFAQNVSERLMGEVEALQGGSLVQDRGPPLSIHVPEPGPDDGEGGKCSRPLPQGDPRHYVYVDNLGVLSTDRSLVQQALVEITAQFEGCDLRLHPGEVHDDPIDALGCRLSGTSRRASLKPLRLLRVRLAIRHALRQRTLSGRVVEVLVGHCTYCALLNRSLMCIFNTAYKFI